MQQGYDPEGNHFGNYAVNGSIPIFAPQFVFGATAPSGPRPPHSRGLYITQNDASHSVGLLWTSDQLVAENST